jgi:hypothetical protein
MGITVNNASGNADIFKDFIGWSLRQMLQEDFYDNIAVSVNLTFTDDVFKRGRWGELIPVKHEGDTRPLRFNMNVAQTYQMMRSLRFIAHECAHVAQLVSGNYYYDSVNDQLYWQRKLVDEDAYAEGFEPWEIEARGLEFCLVEGFIQARGYQNERWYQRLD